MEERDREVQGDEGGVDRHAAVEEVPLQRLQLRDRFLAPAQAKAGSYAEARG
jgi:hypothetical protein